LYGAQTIQRTHRQTEHFAGNSASRYYT
jgi:hypothetical protein